VLQSPNITAKDWLLFKQQIQTQENLMNFQILRVKNSLLKHLLVKNKQSINKPFIQTLCQGPNFLLGCHEISELKTLWNSLNTPLWGLEKPSDFLIGCFYNNSLLNHLDFEVLLKTDETVYLNLFSQLNQKSEIYTILHNSLSVSPLLEIQLSLLTTLSTIKQLKASDSR